MTQLQPKAPHSAGQERKQPKLEQGSGCGGQMDRAQTMAERQPQRFVRKGMNGVLAADFWAPDVGKSSKLKWG